MCLSHGALFGVVWKKHPNRSFASSEPVKEPCVQKLLNVPEGASRTSEQIKRDKQSQEACQEAQESGGGSGMNDPLSARCHAPDAARSSAALVRQRVRRQEGSNDFSDRKRLSGWQLVSSHQVTHVTSCHSSPSTMQHGLFANA